MIHYNYSREQLEQKSIMLLEQFDSERLVKTKPIDVYAVIEKCLNVPYDWKYLTPNQSILGMTAFTSGRLPVWPKPYYKDGIKPFYIFVEEGTILIDSTLTELPDPGAENFTVMHEVFHQILHERCFRHSNPNYTHCTTKKALEHKKRHPMTSLEICEYQANACAAAFLMPRSLLIDKVNQYAGKTLHFHSQPDLLLTKELAVEFNVSLTAMKYRMTQLGLAE